MLLKDLEWVIKEFMFDVRPETNIGYFISELTIYNDQVRVDIFRSYDKFGNPGDYIRIFKDSSNIHDYTVFDFKRNCTKKNN